MAEKQTTSEKYVQGIGRRKTSVAQVRIVDAKPKKDELPIAVNGKSPEAYFPTEELVRQSKKPLELVGLLENVRVSCVVRGGGKRGQAEAMRLGVARALVALDENLKPALRSAKFLTRDARKVERKKAGLKKARRAPQWSKR